jgi:hypothetical protein
VTAPAVSPNPSHLGDLVTVVVAHGTSPAFAPFAVRSHDGDRYVLQCLDPACVPQGRARRIVVPGLPPIVVVPRVTAREVARPAASFRRETTLPPPRYRIDPTLLRALLAVAAVVAAAFAAYLLRPARRDRRSALERALVLARASAGRPPDDRRRALDLLGRAAGDGRILVTAWNAPEPTPERVLAIADAVERGG